MSECLPCRGHGQCLHSQIHGRCRDMSDDLTDDANVLDKSQKLNTSAIRARLAAATPWHEWSNGPDDVRTLLAEVERLQVESASHEHDAAHLAHGRDELAAENARLRDEVAKAAVEIGRKWQAENILLALRKEQNDYESAPDAINAKRIKERDAVKAQLARAVELLLGFDCYYICVKDNPNPGHSELCNNIRDFIRTTEGGGDGA